MISAVFLRGQKKLEEATSGKGPQVALFPFHRRLQPCLGYLWTSFNLPLKKNTPLQNHIFCIRSPANARTSVPSVSLFCISCSSGLSILFQRHSLIVFISSYVDLLRKLCILKALSDLAGTQSHSFCVRFRPKSWFFVRPSGG